MGSLTYDRLDRFITDRLRPVRSSLIRPAVRTKKGNGVYNAVYHLCIRCFHPSSLSQLRFHLISEPLRIIGLNHSTNLLLSHLIWEEGQMRRKMTSRVDYLTDLPQSIIETILTKMPLRDAVRTSILSSKWRYKWATLTHLVFNDKCASGTRDRSLAKFISRFLLLHHGPINRFVLSTAYLQSSPDLDQWLLFLSRKDVKELVLELGGEWFKAPSCLFSCQKLVNLELFRWALNPPLSFKGFPYLKHLSFQQVLIGSEALQNLISGCILLETLNLSYYDSLELTICSPNLKFLILEGCKFDKFLGNIPSLQRLIGRSYFTEYMSIGNNTFGKTEMKYEQLKFIELSQVSFEHMKELKVVLRLILNSPNLEELQIAGSSNSSSAREAPDLDFWEKECEFDSKFEHLKMVKMMDMSGVPHEIGFIGFMLGNSPVLETMSIIPSVYMTEDRLMFLIELTKFKRASPEAEMIFVQD
ncbi:unnamed protein product [Lactuca virosa]|uniref:FBD domain-containing protein n=1 Tax=Lactuca virosa TaxID=75947 RepID=A0AAU9MTG0_9ASTR|nr:unnamed protein product [Lactuca virosa]